MVNKLNGGRISLVHLGKRNAGPKILMKVAQSLDLSDNLAGVIHAKKFDSVVTQGQSSRALHTYESMLGFICSIFLLPFRCMQTLFFLKSFNSKKVMFIMPHLWDFVLIPFLKIFGNFEIIYWVHDGQTHPGDSRVLTRLNQKVAICFADVIVALSEYVADTLQAQTRKRILVITHPVENLSEHRTRTIRNLNAPKVLFIGRLVRYKGLERLKNAWELFCVDFPESELLIAGSGDEEYVRDLFSNLTNVRMELRYLNSVEMERYFRESDILAIPYDEASQSGILLQGIENQLMYVATPVGAIPEQNLLLGGGLLADDMSSKSFAESMKAACRIGSIEINNLQEHTWELELDRLLIGLNAHEIAPNA